MSAIAAALAAGFPIEIDVQCTADNQALVFHDSGLERMTGFSGVVCQTSSQQTGKLHLGNSTEAPPLLEDVLDLVQGQVGLLVEIKNSGRSGSLEKTVGRILADYNGPLAIQSFNTLTLNWFAKHYPSLLRGHLSCTFDTDRTMTGWQKFLLKNYAGIGLSRPHFIAYNFRDLPMLVPTLLRRVFRLPLLGWTARTAEEYHTARQRTDNVIFEGFLPSAGVSETPAGS